MIKIWNQKNCVNLPGVRVLGGKRIGGDDRGLEDVGYPPLASTGFPGSSRRRFIAVYIWPTNIIHIFKSTTKNSDITNCQMQDII